MNDWWETFFDQDYLRIWGQIFTDQFNTKQAAELWSLLHLNPGCRVLDAPCGWGRLSRQLALLGATVLGVDQSETLLTEAEAQRGELPTERLRYIRHDLRKPLLETGFDVAWNIFTSFGYGTEDEDVATFRTLRAALRPGGRVLVETNHRDMLCALLSRSSTASMRLFDGTLFIDEPDFDAISGVVSMNWYWSGPGGSGEKHAEWRCYTPTQIVSLLERAGLRFVEALQGVVENTLQSRGAGGGRAASLSCNARKLALVRLWVTCRQYGHFGSAKLPDCRSYVQNAEFSNVGECLGDLSLAEGGDSQSFVSCPKSRLYRQVLRVKKMQRSASSMSELPCSAAARNTIPPTFSE